MNFKIQDIAKLVHSESYTSLWSGLVLPWLDENKDKALKEGVSPYVIVPNTFWGNRLKKFICENKQSVIGLQICTPGALRRCLLNAFDDLAKSALREELHLLYSVVANKQLNNPIAKSGLSNPSMYLKAFDQLHASGWDSNAFIDPDARELGLALEMIMSDTGVLTIQQLDKILWERSFKRNTLLGNILIIGFSENNWDQKLLLESAVRFSKHAIMCHVEGNLSDSAQVWTGFWEDNLNVSHFSFDVEQEFKKYEYLASCFENEIPLATPAEEPLSYGFAHNIYEESQLIVYQAVKYLEVNPSKSICVLVPGPCALSREICVKLDELKLSYYDGLGHAQPIANKEKLLNAWLAWQEENKLAHLRIFLNELHISEIIDTEAYKLFESDLKIGFSEVLCEDVTIIKTYLEQIKPGASILKFLDKWKLLNKIDTFSAYFIAAQFYLDQLGYKNDIDAIREKSKKLINNLSVDLSKSAFISYLRDICKVAGKVRSYYGSERFASIQVITVEQALGFEWDQLIIAGMNKGSWPRDLDENVFLDASCIQRLNQSIEIQGKGGEGDRSLKKGYSWILNEKEKKKNNIHNIASIISLTNDKILLTASLSEEDNFDKEALLSDYLIRLYWVEKNALIDKEFINQNRFFIKQEENIKQYKEVLDAYTLRRDATNPFGEYEYGFNKDFKGKLTFSCKVWEETLKNPVKTWFSHVLRIKPKWEPGKEDLGQLLIGKWVHSWICVSNNIGNLNVCSEYDTLKKQIEEASFKTKHVVQKSYEGSARTLPSWWQSLWNEAKKNTIYCAKQLSKPNEYGFSAQEMSVCYQSNYTDFDLDIEGRLDFIFSNQSNIDAVSDSLKLWIVDIKTGSRNNALKDLMLSRGKGLQVALYALSYYLKGVKNIGVSYLGIDTELEEQMDLESILKQESIFNGLIDISNKGVLGQMLERYAFNGKSFQYPLAVLNIDPHVLERKWKLTHPKLPEAKEILKA